MILATPKRHFDDDMDRAAALLAHASTIPTGTLQDDILRGAWMMGVGACDAYFSDAYGDLLARTLRAKALEPTVEIPDRLNNLRVPVIAVLREGAGGWRWRMAARELIEEEYRSLNGTQRGKATLDAVDHLEMHFEEIFQRRHDCIHNCDRPKIALQGIDARKVEKTLYDIRFLVDRCNEAFLVEFPIYLRDMGFNAVTRNRVG